MASKDWQESLQKLLQTPPSQVRPSDIFVLPRPEEDDEVEAVIRKMNQGLKLTDEEIQILPDHYRQVYFLEEDSRKDESSIAKRKQWEMTASERRLKAERKTMIEERIARKLAYYQPLTDEEYKIIDKIKNPKDAEKHEKVQKKIKAAQEKALYDRAINKLETWQQLTAEERHILDTYRHVDVDASEILTDVVNGDYTLQDVHLVSEGASALSKDATENSPIQLLEQVLESMKRQTQEALQTSDTDQFFNTTDADLLSRITPLQLNEIISSCKTGIELLHGARLDENEAKSAVESFLKAMVMSEGENKIREALKAAEMKQKKIEQQREESMAEIAAVVTGAFSDEASKEREPHEIGFNITETEFDITFMPPEDEAYKPLEIISYLGMTNCK